MVITSGLVFVTLFAGFCTWVGCTLCDILTSDDEALEYWKNQITQEQEKRSSAALKSK